MTTHARLQTRYASVTCVGALLAVGSPCAAQTVSSFLVTPYGQPVPVQQGAVAPDGQPAPSGEPGATPGAEAGVQDSEETPEKLVEKYKEARLEKLGEVSFDRSPEGVLNAWAERWKIEPVEEKDEEGEEASGEEETSATEDEASETETDADDEKEAQDDAAAEEDEEAAQAKKKAEEIKELKAAHEKELEELDELLKEFQQDVTLGRWDELADTFEQLASDEERKKLYERLLSQLPNARGSSGGGNQRYAAKALYDWDDVFGVAAAAPAELESEQIASLGRLVRLAIESGHDAGELIAKLREDAAKEEAARVFQPEQLPRLLDGSGQLSHGGEFLPPPESVFDKKELEKDDVKTAAILSRFYLVRYREETDKADLDIGWRLLQRILKARVAGDDDRRMAIERSLGLADRVGEKRAEAWLDDLFRSHPKLGIAAIKTVGQKAVDGLKSNPRSPDRRRQGLERLAEMAAALLRVDPDLAEASRPALDLIALAWIREADFARQYDHTNYDSPRMQRDMFGNYYFNRAFHQGSGNNDMPSAVPCQALLESRPEGAWAGLIEASLAPRLAELTARLYLKVREPDEAFPHLEAVADADAEKGRELATEFLRVWAKKHDPNSSRYERNPYIFYYGYEQKADGIPLTRSQQDRNLKELAGWVAKIAALPIEPVDESVIVDAFTTAHSSAEVYRPEAIRAVFGEGRLEPEAVAGLAENMRRNLAGVWRSQKTQDQKKTNRKAQDIRREVLRGYEVAKAFVADSIERRPDDWRLTLAAASIAHDENDYLNEIEYDSGYAPRRKEAIAAFARAARLYAETVPDLREDEETTEPFEKWFYASLGACDLNRIDEETTVFPDQTAAIAGSINALPGDAAERHLERFASQLFARMSSIKPQVKFRYLENGFAVVGDHEAAEEASEVLRYYRDLVTEIELRAEIDGDSVVGHREPFGVLVSLVHTREIERESGGFGKYLQNQNSGNAFFYNYGRPLANYRDRFEETVAAALDEQFELLSITFEEPSVNSLAVERYGWRQTPYAYLLLRATGPDVDVLPPLRLDLDFLDTSGYAALPVESAPAPLDARPEVGRPRPVANLDIVQTLDERQADEGRLLLEVRATGRGLIGPLDTLLELDPEDFEVVATEDQGLAVSRFDDEGAGVAVVSERSWLVELAAKPGLDGAAPKTFRFATPTVEVTEASYQRYDDADLIPVEAVVQLEEEYARYAWAMPAAIAAAALVPLTVVILAWRGVFRGPSREEAESVLPESLTPFQAITHLRAMRPAFEGDADLCRELEGEIARLEREHFAVEGRDAPDPSVELRSSVGDWASRLNGSGV